MRQRTWLAMAAIAFSPCVSGAESRDEALERATRDTASYAPAWKLTPTYYHSSNQPSALDVNLRGTLGQHNAWLGYYRRHAEYEQARLGYDYTADMPFGRVVPSVQYATRGFLGGSVLAEIGGDNFGLLGWGRTNVRDYYNLNFDPNDAVTFGAGTRMLPDTTVSLFRIQDDRLRTGQRVTHLVVRVKSQEKRRWTIDVFHKEGRSDADPASEVLRGTGAGVAYDYDRYFVRITRDPYVNFTASHMTRIALGWRF